MDIIKDAAQNITNRLTWHTAGRDQTGIARELAGVEDIPEVYGVGEAGLKFYWHIDPFILHSQSLMRLVGFNGRQVREGTSQRGKKITSADSSEKKKEFRKEESGQ